MKAKYNGNNSYSKEYKGDRKNGNSFATPEKIRQNVIGSSDGHSLQGPFGKKPIVYADSTASGKSLSFIENYIQQVVMPYYANTHTEASSTGLQTSRFREQARENIRNALNAPKNEYAVLFTGSGSTSAIDKLARAMGISQHASKDFTNRPNERPVVFIGPYEHHSNEVMWRETQAEVVVIPECSTTGSIDVDRLEEILKKYNDRKLKIGSFSAASNVTGIRSDTKTITDVLHRYGALACFDFAAAGPHVTMDVSGHDMDAMYLSVHKFVGGPQTPGLLVVRRSVLANTTVPTVPGGGTVDYVQPHSQVYSDDIEHREEGGTPAIIESIRAGLVLKLHSKVDGGHVDDDDDDMKKHGGWIERTEARYLEKAFSKWEKNPNIVVLGNQTLARVPIISFMIKAPESSSTVHDDAIHNNKNTVKDHNDDSPPMYLHYNFITSLLNDLFGIQSRGGCSCAGPYGHLLLNIDQTKSDQIMSTCQRDGDTLKPGWARLAFSYYMDEKTVDYIINAVDMVATDGYKLLPWYQVNTKTTMWNYIPDDTVKTTTSTKSTPLDLWDFNGSFEPAKRQIMKQSDKKFYLDSAKKLLKKLDVQDSPTNQKGMVTELSPSTNALRWFILPEEIRSNHDDHRDDDDDDDIITTEEKASEGVLAERKKKNHPSYKRHHRRDGARNYVGNGTNRQYHHHHTHHHRQQHQPRRNRPTTRQQDQSRHRHGKTNQQKMQKQNSTQNHQHAHQQKTSCTKQKLPQMQKKKQGQNQHYFRRQHYGHSQHRRLSLRLTASNKIVPTNQLATFLV